GGHAGARAATAGETVRRGGALPGRRRGGGRGDRKRSGLVAVEFDEIRTIGVVGAGTMGAGIAQVCVAAGYPVLLYDTAPHQLEAAEARVRRGLDVMASKGRIAAAEEAAGRL